MRRSGKFFQVLVLFLWIGFGLGPNAVRPMAALGRLSLLALDISITLNPSGIVPLTALALFRTSRTCGVQVEVMGEVAVEKAFENDGTDHILPILGLYPGRLNRVLLTLFTHHGTPEKHLLSIQTDPLPNVFPQIEIAAADPSRIEPGMNLSTLTVRLGANTAFFLIIPVD